MLLTDTTVPPEYAAKLARLVSMLPADDSFQRTARTRRGARQSLKQPTIRPALTLVRDACEKLADACGLPLGHPERELFITAQSIAILQGDFDEAYWTSIDPIFSITFDSRVTSVPDTHARPYAYRRINNLPTKPTYAYGEQTAGDPAYTGALVGNYFCDTAIRWLRAIFPLRKPIDRRLDNPTFLKLGAALTIDADARGSRPMASILAKAEFAPWIFIDDYDATPPVHKNLSFYWRFKPPADTAPYYHASFSRDIVARIVPTETELALGAADRLAVSILPRPMYGHANNNNAAVSVTLAPTLEIFQMRNQTYSWKQLPDGPARYDHATRWDEPNNRLLLYGGSPLHLDPLAPPSTPAGATAAWISAGGGSGIPPHYLTPRQEFVYYYTAPATWLDLVIYTAPGLGGVENGHDYWLATMPFQNPVHDQDYPVPLDPPNPRANVLLAPPPGMDAWYFALTGFHAPMPFNNLRWLWRLTIPSTELWQYTAAAAWELIDANYSPAAWAALAASLPDYDLNPSAPPSPATTTSLYTLTAAPDKTIYQQGGTTDAADSGALGEFWIYSRDP